MSDHEKMLAVVEEKTTIEQLLKVNALLTKENEELREALKAYNRAFDLAATARGARKTKISGSGTTRQQAANEALREARQKTLSALATQSTSKSE